MSRSFPHFAVLATVPVLMTMFLSGQVRAQDEHAGYGMAQAQPPSRPTAPSDIGSPQSPGEPSGMGGAQQPNRPPDTGESGGMSQGTGPSRHMPPEMEPPKPMAPGLAKPLKGKPTPGAVTMVIVNRLARRVTLNGVLQHMARGINLAKPVQIVVEPGATVRPVFQLDDTRLLDQHSHWKIMLAGEGLPAGKVISGALQKTGRTIELTPSSLGISKRLDEGKRPPSKRPDEEEWRKDPRKRPDGDKKPPTPESEEEEWRKDPHKRPDGDKKPPTPGSEDEAWRKDPHKRPDGEKKPPAPESEDEAWRKDPHKRPDDDKKPPTPGSEDEAWRKDPHKRPDGDKKPPTPGPEDEAWRKEPHKRPDGGKQLPDQEKMRELKGRPTPGPVTVIIVNRLDTKIVVNCSLKHKARGLNLAKPIQIVVEPGKSVRPSFQLDDTRLVDEHAQWIFSVAGEGIPAGKEMSGMIQKSGRTIEITHDALKIKPLRKRK